MKNTADIIEELVNDFNQIVENNNEVSSDLIIVRYNDAKQWLEDSKAEQLAQDEDIDQEDLNDWFQDNTNSETNKTNQWVFEAFNPEGTEGSDRIEDLNALPDGEIKDQLSSENLTSIQFDELLEVLKDINDLIQFGCTDSDEEKY